MNIKLLLMIVILLFIVGCAPKNFIEIEEERVIGSTGDSYIANTDTETYTESTEEVQSKKDFVDSFITFWKKEQYSVLYEFISDKQRLSRDEFEYLARNAAEAEQISSVSVYQREGNIVKFEIKTNRYIKRIPTELVYSNKGWLAKPFYIFADLSANNVCEDRSKAVTLEECGLDLENTDKTRCILEKKKSCLFEYAQVSGNEDYCDLTGNLKGHCLLSLGVEIDMTQTIEDCYSFPTESEQADCLLELARATGDIEVCRATTFERTKYSCYGLVAVKEKNVSKCEEYIREEGFFTSFRNALCVFAYVEETGHTNYCSLITNDDNSVVGSIKEQCSELRWE